MRRVITALALLAVLLTGFAAQARQDDPRLDALFERLQTTKDDAEAASVERQIWSIWMEAGSEDLNVLMQQGAVAMSAQDFGLALESFNALIALAPDMAEAWNKRATLYYMMQNFEASVADVQQTLALEPRHFGAIIGMGLIYDQIGDQQAALRAFEQGLKINPHMDQIREKSEKIAQELRDRNI
jgi:tetratricopeptide (TPR) repeat protein